MSQCNRSNETDKSMSSDRPIVCILEDDDSPNKQRCRMFKVIRSKGKALASGGFGVTIPNSDRNSTDEQETTNDSGWEVENTSDAESKSSDDQENKTKLFNAVKTNERKSSEYLFIEEVLFLHEKGLLQALLPSNNSSSNKKEGKDLSVALEASEKRNVVFLDTSQLYQLLPKLGIDLAIYRVYSHLRSQDFRVLRHDPNRYEILCRQREDAEERRRRKLRLHAPRREKQPEQADKESLPSNSENEESRDPAVDSEGSNPRKQSLRLRRKIRDSIQHAPPPSIPVNCSSGTIGICWDAYKPNSNFGKTHPGFPDFYVTVTYYNVPMVVFSDVHALIKEKCNGIPLKVATVSDSGTVVMFGMTDYGIPSLSQKATTVD